MWGRHSCLPAQTGMSAPPWGAVVATCRRLSISAGSSGSTGRHGSTGLEDEDEDEDERMLYREPMRELAAAADGTAGVG